MKIDESLAEKYIVFKAFQWAGIAGVLMIITGQIAMALGVGDFEVYPDGGAAVAYPWWVYVLMIGGLFLVLISIAYIQFTKDE